MAGRGFDQTSAWIVSVMLSGGVFTGIYFGVGYVAKKQAHKSESSEGGHANAGHEAPASGHEAPASGHEAPASGHEAPASGHETPKSSGAAHWGYTGEHGQSHWAGMDERNKACAGRRQSPVDIDHSKTTSGLKPIQFNYKQSAVTVKNAGHAVQVDFPPGNWIALNGERYDLLQFHFHVPSEHRVEGSQYEMEVHLVHKNAHDELAVVGVFFKDGAENKILSPVWSIIPPKPAMAAKPIKFNPSQLLPKLRRYVTYEGSLTTPPCSEVVTWLVMQEAITASASQFDTIVKTHGFNARDAQPLYGRELQRSAN